MHTLCPCSPSLLFSTSSSSSGSFYTLSRPLPSPPTYRIMRSNGDKFILLHAIHSSKTVDLHPNNTSPVKAFVLITSSSQHTNLTITTTIVVLLYWHEPPRNHLARERSLPNSDSLQLGNESCVSSLVRSPWLLLPLND